VPRCTSPSIVGLRTTVSVGDPEWESRIRHGRWIRLLHNAPIHLRASGSAGDGARCRAPARQGVNAMATLDTALVGCNG
jgi:hypothetical protein